MMFMFAFTGPAGIGLYWLASGIFTIFQQLFNNLYYKPKIEAEVREKMGPVKKIKRKRRVRRDVTPNEETSSLDNDSPKRNANRNRNAGRQQRNRRD